MKAIFIDMDKLLDAEGGDKDALRRPVGYSYDEHNRRMALFVGTDVSSGKIRTDINGNVRLNIKPMKES